MRLGLEKEGWRLAFANDIDPNKEEILPSELPDADRHFVPGDINCLSSSQIPNVSLATASFPAMIYRWPERGKDYREKLLGISKIH